MNKVFLLIMTTIIGFSANAAAKGKITSIDNSRFATIIATENVQLVDVRTPSEFNESRIAGAVNINVMPADFVDRISELDLTKPVAVYCHAGARSMKAAKILRDKGFTVYNLKDGFVKWNGPTGR